MSRYQWRFVWGALVAWVVSALFMWLLTSSLSPTFSDGAFSYALLNALIQISFYLGVLFAGGAVLLAVLRSDRADQYELASDEPFEPEDPEPDGPFAGMID